MKLIASFAAALAVYVLLIICFALFSAWGTEYLNPGNWAEGTRGYVFVEGVILVSGLTAVIRCMFK